MMNTLLSAILVKMTNIITIIIKTDAFQFLPCLSLKQSLKILGYIMNLILGLQREYPEFKRMIINKSHKIKCTTLRPYLKRTTQIRMYQLQQIKLSSRWMYQHTCSTLLSSLWKPNFSYSNYPSLLDDMTQSSMP